MQAFVDGGGFVEPYLENSPTGFLLMFLLNSSQSKYVWHIENVECFGVLKKLLSPDGFNSAN